jgi:hypothetical protein
VRGIDACSWKYERLDLVTFSFQIRLHLLEYHPGIPTNKAENILCHDPARSDLPNCSKHAWPQVALIFVSKPLSGEAVWLAGEPSGEDVDVPVVNAEVCRPDVFITKCFWKIMFKQPLTEWIELAMKYVFPPHPFRSKIKPADAAKKTPVF